MIPPQMNQAFNSTMPSSAINAGAMGVAPPATLPSGVPVPAGSPGLGASRGFANGGVVPTFKGAIVSAVPGRTDKHFTHVPSGSFVIPADIVSAHGEGNTLAGNETLLKLFRMNDSHAKGLTDSDTSKARKLAAGGHADSTVGKPVPVKLAGGEIVVPPEHVHETMQRITKKKLTLDQSHQAMDAWVIAQRKKLRKTLAKLPGPARD